MNYYYPEREQDLHYRWAAWDRGCTCPMLPTDIHFPGCPLHRTDEEWAAFLEEEHVEDGLPNPADVVTWAEDEADRVFHKKYGPERGNRWTFPLEGGYRFERDPCAGKETE